MLHRLSQHYKVCIKLTLFGAQSTPCKSLKLEACCIGTAKLSVVLYIDIIHGIVILSTFENLSSGIYRQWYHTGVLKFKFFFFPEKLREPSKKCHDSHVISVMVILILSSKFRIAFDAYYKHGLWETINWPFPNCWWLTWPVCTSFQSRWWITTFTTAPDPILLVYAARNTGTPSLDCDTCNFAAADIQPKRIMLPKISGFVEQTRLPQQRLHEWQTKQECWLIDWSIDLLIEDMPSTYKLHWQAILKKQQHKTTLWEICQWIWLVHLVDRTTDIKTRQMLISHV